MANLRNILIGGAAGTVLLGGLALEFMKGEPLVKDEEINGKFVTYIEGDFTPNPLQGFNKNVMKVYDPETGASYILRDTNKETDIEYSSRKRPAFNKDIPERMVVKVGSEKREYEKNPDHDNDLDYDHSIRMIAEGTNEYNSLRTAIREHLREKRIAENKEFEDAFIK